ncbi:MAG: hypothetical protein QXF82_00820 [Nitrososphaeria archaeon]
MQKHQTEFFTLTALLVIVYMIAKGAFHPFLDAIKGVGYSGMMQHKLPLPEKKTQPKLHYKSYKEIYKEYGKEEPWLAKFFDWLHSKIGYR